MIPTSQVSIAAYGVQSYEPAPKAAGTKNAPPSSSAAGGEKVNLSDAAVTLKMLHDVIAAMPDIRIPSVEKIKQKIAMNGYPIESSLYKAVEKLVRNKTI
jgi:hypothetical protein